MHSAQLVSIFASFIHSSAFHQFASMFGMHIMDATQIPLDATQIPLDATQIPLDATQIPLDATQIPL